MDSADCDEHLKRGPGGRTTSSGTEPFTTTAESVDDAVRRLVVERSHDLVTLCDLTGAIVYASPSWTNLGWDPAALAGVEVLELIHPDDAEKAMAAWNKVASGTDVDSVTIRLRRASGSFAWFEVNGSSVHDEAGELRFMLGTARDVSEREELRWRLRDLDAVYRFAGAGSRTAIALPPKDARRGRLTLRNRSPCSSTTSPAPSSSRRSSEWCARRESARSR